MTNTGFKAMNDEELGLVTGGLCGDDLFTFVNDTVRPGALEETLKKTVDDIKDICSRIVHTISPAKREMLNR